MKEEAVSRVLIINFGGIFYPPRPEFYILDKCEYMAGKYQASITGQGLEIKITDADVIAFLVEKGALPPGHAEAYLGQCMFKVIAQDLHLLWTNWLTMTNVVSWFYSRCDGAFARNLGTGELETWIDEWKEGAESIKQFDINFGSVTASSNQCLKQLIAEYKTFKESHGR